jgi:hypothetical protein
LLYSQNTVQPPPVLVVRVDRLELVHLVEVPSLQSGSAASTLDPASVPTHTEGRGNQHLGAVPHTHSNGLRIRRLHPDPHSVPYGTRPHFSFALAHQKKGIAFATRAMPTMKGAVQEDEYRTEVRFKDKNLF